MSPRGMDWDKAKRFETARQPGSELSPFRRMSIKQRRLIRDLERRLGREPADLSGLSLQEAAELIERLRREDRRS